jgi:CRP-like cAMP-binding protein
LASLLPAEYDRIVALAEPVALEVNQILYTVHQPITHVYFPLSSVNSLLVIMEDGETAEVGTVGSEGMVGLPVFLGATSTPGQALTQIAGDALRMPTEAFVKAVLEADGPVYRVLQRYTQALFVQATQGAACNLLHSMEARFCRWVLTTHDRVGRDSFPLPLEFIAMMIGLRRTSIRAVAAVIKKVRFVSYRRDTLTILDRPGLEACSCVCYGVIRGEFERLGA